MSSKRSLPLSSLPPLKQKEVCRPNELKKIIEDNLEYFGRLSTCMIIASGKRTIGERQKLVAENMNEFLRGTCLSKYQ